MGHLTNPSLLIGLIMLFLLFSTCRPTLLEQQALARVCHEFQTKYDVPHILESPPRHFQALQQLCCVTLLGVTQSNYPVLLLKVRGLEAVCVA